MRTYAWKTAVNELMAKMGYRIVRRKIDLFDVLRLKRVSLVIDVGANEGQFGLLLRRGGYRGRIASFEPIPEVYAKLMQACSKDGNWDAFPMALGEYDGVAELHVAKSSQLSSLLCPTKWNQARENQVAQVREETVKVHRLDTLFADLGGDRPFLKIDVQGAEEIVLRGAEKSLPNIVGVQLEIGLYQFYESQLLMSETLNLMSNHGFVPAVIDPIGYYEPTDPCRLMEIDCIFVRGGHRGPGFSPDR
jgi:FkbM family methyltransferase